MFRKFTRKLKKYKSDKAFTETFLRNSWKVITLFVAVSILSNLYARGVIAIAYVNHHPVTFSEIMYKIKKDGIKGSLTEIINEKIIQIEAQDNNVIVTSYEIRQKIEMLEEDLSKQGKTLNQILEDNDKTLEDVEKSYKLRITIYKLIEDDLEVTEDEIIKYIEENQDFYNDTEIDEIKDEIKRLLTEQKMDMRYETWLKEAKAASEVNYFIDL